MLQTSLGSSRSLQSRRLGKRLSTFFIILDGLPQRSVRVIGARKTIAVTKVDLTGRCEAMFENLVPSTREVIV